MFGYFEDIFAIEDGGGFVADLAAGCQEWWFAGLAALVDTFVGFGDEDKAVDAVAQFAGQS